MNNKAKRMWIESIRLVGFRGHRESMFRFTPRVNVLWGLNGAGKTNVLEAIHYLSLTKSFLSVSDQYVVQHGQRFFEVEGLFRGARRSVLRVRVVFVPSEGKRVFVNGATQERISEHIGTIPLVVFSPEDVALTAGEPEGRRRFLNNILSQSKPRYLHDLFQYRRALKQRNELLLRGRRLRHTLTPSVKEAWDEEMIVLGSRIVWERLRLMDVFRPYLQRACDEMESEIETPSLHYQTFAPLQDDEPLEAIEDKYRRALLKVEDRERDRGQTLIGPHRDEVLFLIDGQEIRRYGSQGQHRTLGIVLKLAQLVYLNEMTGEPPLFLLDDVFDHLDPSRGNALLRVLQMAAVGQSILTTPRLEPFEAGVDFSNERHQALHILKRSEEVYRDK